MTDLWQAGGLAADGEAAGVGFGGGDVAGVGVAGVDGSVVGDSSVVDDAEAAAVDRAQAGGVAVADGVVVGVGVAVEGLWVGGVEVWVEGDEPAGGGVVLAGADVGQSGGGVGGVVEEAVVVGPDPGTCGAAGVRGGGVADLVAVGVVPVARLVDMRVGGQAGEFGPQPGSQYSVSKRRNSSRALETESASS